MADRGAGNTQPLRVTVHLSLLLLDNAQFDLGASQLAQHEVRVVLRYQLLKQVKTTHFKLVSEKHPNFMPSLYTVVGGTRYTEEQVICNHALHSTLQLLAVSAPNTQYSNHTRHKSYHDRQAGCESTESGSYTPSLLCFVDTI